MPKKKNLYDFGFYVAYDCYKKYKVKSPFIGPSFSFFNGFDDMDDPFFAPFGGASRNANAFRSQSFTHGSPSNERKNRKQDPPIEHDLYLSLEEVLNGCVKKMKITRKVLNPDGKTYKKEDKVLTINVVPGWKAGTKVTFQHEGDRSGSSSMPADIVFTIRDKPHPHFKREGNNIVYTAKISLRAVCTYFTRFHSIVCNL